MFNLYDTALFPENCPPPLTPHNRILCWRERIIFVTVELLERKFNFLPIITQYKCYPWSVSQGTFYQIMAIPEKHTSPVTARGNIIHNWEINRIQQIQNLISYKYKLYSFPDHLSPLLLLLRLLHFTPHWAHQPVAYLDCVDAKCKGWEQSSSLMNTVLAEQENIKWKLIAFHLGLIKT